MKMLGKKQSFENCKVNEVKINQKVCVSSVKPNKCRNVNNHHLYALDSNYSIILSLPRKKQARSYYSKNLNTVRTYTSTYEWIYEPSRLYLLKGSNNELEGIQGIFAKASNNPVIQLSQMPPPNTRGAYFESLVSG